MYYVYKVVNKINEKFYYGVHKSDNIENDSYLGSGTVIKKAVEKYGKENFERLIIKEFNNKYDAYNFEKEIVDINDKNCYNIKDGGIGGWDYVNSLELENCMKNPEIAKRNVKTKRKNGFYKSKIFLDSCRQNIQKGIDYNTGREKTDDHKNKLSTSVREYYKTHNGVNKGKIFSDETKKKMSDSWTKERRDKQSDLQKERIKNNPSIVITNKGRKWSEKTKSKMNCQDICACLQEHAANLLRLLAA